MRKNIKFKTLFILLLLFGSSTFLFLILITPPTDNTYYFLTISTIEYNEMNDTQAEKNIGHDAVPIQINVNIIEENITQDITSNPQNSEASESTMVTFHGEIEQVAMPWQKTEFDLINTILNITSEKYDYFLNWTEPSHFELTGRTTVSFEIYISIPNSLKNGSKFIIQNDISSFKVSNSLRRIMVSISWDYGELFIINNSQNEIINDSPKNVSESNGLKNTILNMILVIFLIVILFLIIIKIRTKRREKGL